MPATKKAAKRSGVTRPGLYANIKAKHDRIAHGSGEQMRKPGEKGAPSSDAFEQSQETSQSSKSSRAASAKTARKKTSRKASRSNAPAKRRAR